MVLVQVKQIKTGTRYDLEILHQRRKRVKTKGQKFLGDRSYVCRSYRGKKTERRGGRPPFLIGLKTHLADSQKLSKDLLIVCQILEYCQLFFWIFVTLRRGAVVHYNLSEKPNWYFKRHSSISKLNCSLACIFFKCFSNDTENTHMIIALFGVSVTLVQKPVARLVFYTNIEITNLVRKTYPLFDLESLKECMTA